MPSPFPGMDPYFEQPARWRQFHTRFLVEFQNRLTAVLPAGYTVELEEALHLEQPGQEGGRVFAVADAAVTPPTVEAGGLAVATATAPVVGTVPIPDQKPTRWLAVRDSAGEPVVTVIELLSPSNKRPGPDRDRYLDKRFEVMSSATHLVEIDLLRGGRRMPVQGLPACDYCVLVSRAGQRPQVGLWPIGLRDRLPDVPVPLRAGDPEPVVGLRPILDGVYDGAGYAAKLYRQPPEPPLSPADAAWAASLVPPG